MSDLLSRKAPRGNMRLLWGPEETALDPWREKQEVERGGMKGLGQ